MKYRVVAAVVLVAVLGLLVLVTNDSQPGSSAPSSSQDDGALKSLNLN